MIDPDRLTELILQCDFNYGQLETICSGYLGLSGDPLANVLGNGIGSWKHRVVDLVAWADRQGLLSELLRGVLNYGADKRPVQEWILNAPMQSGTMTNEATSFFRLELKVDRLLEQQQTIIAEHGEMKRRLGAVETLVGSVQQKQSPTMDRFMVVMLALAMLSMLAFNVSAVLIR